MFFSPMFFYHPCLCRRAHCPGAGNWKEEHCAIVPSPLQIVNGGGGICRDTKPIVCCMRQNQHPWYAPPSTASREMVPKRSS